MSDPQNVMIVPLPQQAPASPAQVPQAQSDSHTVPYDRFQEVIQQKNALADKAAKYEQLLGQVNSTLNPNQGLPQFETAEQLVKFNREETQRLIADAENRFV